MELFFLTMAVPDKPAFEGEMRVVRAVRAKLGPKWLQLDRRRVRTSRLGEGPHPHRPERQRQERPVEASRPDRLPGSRRVLRAGRGGEDLHGRRDLLADQVFRVSVLGLELLHGRGDADGVRFEQQHGFVTGESN